MTTEHERQSVAGRQNRHLSAPALALMIESDQSLYSTAAPNLSIDEALASMSLIDTDVLVVVSEAKELLGVVSREGLLGRSAGGTIRDNETVLRDVMRPASVLFTLEMNDLDNATTREMLTALSDLVEQHVIVVAGHSKEIRGLFSASDMARRMGISSTTDPRSHSFAELAKYLKVQTGDG